MRFQFKPLPQLPAKKGSFSLYTTALAFQLTKPDGTAETNQLLLELTRLKLKKTFRVSTGAEKYQLDSLPKSV